MGVKDQYITEMGLFIKNLRRDLTQAQSITEQAYTFRFNMMVDQAKYLFANKGLDFCLLNPSKLINDILPMGEHANLATQDQMVMQ